MRTDIYNISRHSALFIYYQKEYHEQETAKASECLGKMGLGVESDLLRDRSHFIRTHAGR